MYITETILHYIALPKTSYAIQINGAWGTGKTHYIKNELKHALENDNDSNTEDGFNLCYVSLSGFSSVDQIGEAVFLEIANAKNKLAVQGLKFLGKYGSGIAGLFGNFDQTIANASEDIINKIKDDSNDNFTQIVICFDDLERIDDSLSIKQVFGYINTNYIEHNHVKVIFVSNDEEIVDKKNYKLIREKVIGKTLNFIQPESNVIEDIIINTYKEQENFISYFDIEKENIIKAISLIFDKFNLRTLRFVIDSLVILQKELYRFCNDNEQRIEILNTLFLNVLIVGNEYKNGDIDAVDQLSFVHGLDHFFYFPINDEAEDKYPQRFLKRYHRVSDYIDSYIHYFPSVSNFIINGFLNAKEFKHEINSLIDRRRNEELKSKGKGSPIEILNNFQMFDDRDIEQAQEEVLERVKGGQFPAPDYPRLYNLFLIFRNKDLILTDKFELHDSFKSGFIIALDQWKPTQTLDFWDINIQHTDEVCSHMIESLKDREKQINYQDRKIKMKDWLDAIIQDSVQKDMYNEIEFEKDFFQILIELEITENYFRRSNIFVVEITRFLHHKYLRVTNSYEFHSHEIPYIEQLIKVIDEYITVCKEGKIKLYNLSQFKKQLEKVKGHIKKPD
ncbi:P-loop NTPase fold protein [Radiobacillus deserti]|uniref:KAP NTPase domain-containing protein n=1 Tax=Radiobacillus deserti TaxID=2594883 RepID=A0A516KKR3_9BACI|nr:P-loop NTPase fold protein [Radiobacillus deserti]QDP41972.1 hypothetical protein FN924_18440 [Radiobacillus deserti]